MLSVLTNSGSGGFALFSTPALGTIWDRICDSRMKNAPSYVTKIIVI